MIAQDGDLGIMRGMGRSRNWQRDATLPRPWDDMVTGDQRILGIQITNCVHHLSLSSHTAGKHNWWRHQREPCPILQTDMNLDSRVVYAHFPGFVPLKIADE